jgi:hypothetical protein
MILFDGTIFKDGYNCYSAFKELINNSYIEYLPTHSIHSILFKITFKGLSSPYYKYRGNLFYVDNNFFLLKLVITDYNKNNNNDDIINNNCFFIHGLNRYFSIISKNDFIEEVNIHNNVYMSSFNNDIDPITTNIIYCNHGLENIDTINSFSIKKNNTLTHNIISEINKFINLTNSNIGIVVTECFENIETFNNIYSNWDLNTKLLDLLPNYNKNVFNSDIKSQKIPYLFIYELLKIYYYTEYIYSDPNLDNIIYINDYNCMKGITGKVFIVNFNKTCKLFNHKTDIIDILNEHIQNNTDWYYHWFIELLNPNRILQTINSIEYIKNCKFSLIQELQNNAKYMRIKNNNNNAIKNSNIINPYFIKPEGDDENNRCIEKCKISFKKFIDDINSITLKN